MPKSSCFWTSEKRSLLSWWVVDFNDGHDLWSNNDRSNYVLCVPVEQTVF